MEDSSEMLLRFKKLMAALRDGTLTRNSFRRWEAELLFDIQTCGLPGSCRKKLLTRYEQAVRRRLERGDPQVLKLSEYLAALPSRRAARAAELS